VFKRKLLGEHPTARSGILGCRRVAFRQISTSLCKCHLDRGVGGEPGKDIRVCVEDHIQL
jgi:hypothetical protein